MIKWRCKEIKNNHDQDNKNDATTGAKKSIKIKGVGKRQANKNKQTNTKHWSKGRKAHEINNKAKPI